MAAVRFPHNYLTPFSILCRKELPSVGFCARLSGLEPASTFSSKFCSKISFPFHSDLPLPLAPAKPLYSDDRSKPPEACFFPKWDFVTPIVLGPARIFFFSRDIFGRDAEVGRARGLGAGGGVGGCGAGGGGVVGWVGGTFL